MKVSQFTFTVFLLPFLFFNCKQEAKLSEDAYKVFNVKKEGWKSKKVTHLRNKINYTATEVPLQYYLLKNLGEDYKSIDSIAELNSRERVLEVEFQHASKEDLLLDKYTNKNYEEAVKYMAFEIEKDFLIVTESNDTIKPSGLHFERNFKVAPFKRALIYFNNIPQDETIRLIYNDNLFGNGKIVFDFQELPLKL